MKKLMLNNIIIIAALFIQILSIFYVTLSKKFPILNADTLYLPTLEYTNIFHFRTSPSSYIFPDNIYYSMSGFFSNDIIHRILISGIIQIATCGFILLYFFGPISWVAVWLLYIIFDDTPAFLITLHYNIIMSMALFLVASPRLKPFLILIFGASDPLTLIPILIKKLFDDNLSLSRERYLYIVIFFSWGVAFFICESSKELCEDLFVLIALLILNKILMSIQIIKKFYCETLYQKFLKYTNDVSSAYCGAAISFLAIAALITHQPGRYIEALCGMVVVFIAKSFIETRFSITKALFVTTLSTVFLSIYALPDLIKSGYADFADMKCLGNELHQRGAQVVGADYWTAKPLLLFSGRQDLSVVPINFINGTQFTWIYPYNYLNGSIQYIVRKQCTGSAQEPKHCAVNWLNEHTDNNPPKTICGTYSLYKLDNNIVYSYHKNKIQSFYYNLKSNFSKLAAHL